MLFAVALAFALAGSAVDPAPSTSPVVSAERAFAADGLALGIDESFSRWAAEDAVVIHGEPRRAHDIYSGGKPRDPSEPALTWWPVWAGLSVAGDLGFTTGPFEQNGARAGHYFTVWKRQNDGSWRWVFDGGSQASSDAAPADGGAEPLVLTPGVPAAHDVAARELNAAEAALNARAAVDQKAAHLEVMDPDGRLYVTNLPPALGREAAETALSAWPAAFDFGAAQGGGLAESGDLAWSYGPAAYERNGQPRRGHYIRLWRRSADGWKLAFAQLIPAPQPRPTPAPPPAGG